MADIDITVTDGTLSMASKSELDHDIKRTIDEDLIDYDSDDVYTKLNPTLRADEHALGVADNSVDSHAPIDQDITLKGTYQEDDLESKVGDSVTGELDHHINQDFHEFETETESGNPAEPEVPLSESAHQSIHEIDYEDENFVHGSHNADNQNSPSAVIADPTTSAADDAESADVTSQEVPTEHYEIDWEEDEGTDEHVARGSVKAEVPGATLDTAAEEISEVIQEAFDNEDAASESQGELDAAEQGSPATTHFPDITVQYRGEEYPFFSQSTDGFFSDLSVLDRPMKSVLDGLRLELAHELGTNDDLVLQVDKLGLEFSESSPRETLSTITLRQILELLDILVKNHDLDHSRDLYTYLFTRPNTMKRFEFLVESATGDKTLADVVHIFQPPSDTSAIGLAAYPDALEERLNSYESIDDEGSAHNSREETDDDSRHDRDEKSVGDALEDEICSELPDDYRNEEPADSSMGENGEQEEEDGGAALDAADEHASPEQHYNQDATCFGVDEGVDDDGDDVDPLSWAVERGPLLEADGEDELIGTLIGQEQDVDEVLDDQYHHLDHNEETADYVDADEERSGEYEGHSNDDQIGPEGKADAHDLDTELDEITGDAAAEEDLIEYESIGDENELATSKQYETHHEQAELNEVTENETPRVDNMTDTVDSGVEQSAGDDFTFGEGAMLNDDEKESIRSQEREHSGSSHTEVAPEIISGLDSGMAVVTAHAVEDDIRPLAVDGSSGGDPQVIGDIVLSTVATTLHGSSGAGASFENIETNIEMVADLGDAADIDWMGDMPSIANDETIGSATESQPNSMKRAAPGEFDGEDGNDVKRRRS